MKKFYAFTLIELMVALSIFAIVSLLTLGFFNTIFRQVKNQLAQSQLLHVIKMAQDQTRLRGLPIVFALKKEGGYHLFVNPQEDGILHDRNELIVSVDADNKEGAWHFNAYPRYRDYLLFLPGKHIQNDNASFWYCFRGEDHPDWVITLSQSGRTRIVNANNHQASHPP